MPLNGCSIVVLQVYDNNNQPYAFPVIHDPTHSVKMNWNHCHPYCACHRLCLQCFDAVGWAAGIKKTEWWGAGVVMCLERGADLYMAQLMPLPLTVSCFSKIQIGLTFWYRLIRAVSDNGTLNRCVSVCPHIVSIHWLTPKGRVRGTVNWLYAGRQNRDRPSSVEVRMSVRGRHDSWLLNHQRPAADNDNNKVWTRGLRLRDTSLQAVVRLVSPKCLPRFIKYG